MAIDSIGGIAASTSAAPQATIDQEDLFRILLTQLNYQDPLKPMENAEFIAQLAQFTGLEQSRQTNENITAMLQQQSAGQSIGLVGRTVEVGTDSGSVIGKVTTVSFNTGSPLMSVLTADNQSLDGISLAQVKVVR